MICLYLSYTTTFTTQEKAFFLSYMLLQITLRSFEGLWIPVLKTKATIILKSVA